MLTYYYTYTYVYVNILHIRHVYVSETCLASKVLFVLRQDLQFHPTSFATTLTFLRYVCVSLTSMVFLYFAFLSLSCESLSLFFSFSLFW